MDLALEAWVASLIELSKFKWMLGAGRRWQPGEKLKLFFAGYNGTRNTGADVRVEEMLRQINHVLGAEKRELSVVTQNFELTDGYFKGDQSRYICRTSSRRCSCARCRSTTAWSRAKARCSRANSPTR